MKGKGWRRYG
ncbi:hypothetical protein TIFTF001_041135 [Ficus carica]|uniref:Uncharacterized protein n=1 Tax=Ficus carica TaxID=3494 RepID=A0AA88CNA1_FICCA|nr:hypothetical protein TIFTF001_041135 [Ficus carica]